MITIGTNMRIIENALIFPMGDASPQDGVDASSIENISNEEITRGMMSNMSLIIAWNRRCELMCAEICEDITILWILGGDGEDMLIGKIIIQGWVYCSRR